MRTVMNGAHDTQNENTNANDIKWLGFAKFSANAVAYSLSCMGAPDFNRRIIINI